MIDTVGGVVALGPGIDLDLGAIAKGDAADRACQILAPVAPCLVNVGGDIAVGGRRPASWPVGLATPGEQIVLELTRGALATSGTDRRRWRRAGEDVHHAICPGSGRSAATDVLRATAVAASGAEADALATALVVAGYEDAGELARRWGVPAVVVAVDGRCQRVGGLR